jgi:hypothetical protein
MKKYISPILSIATIAMLFYTLFDLKEQVKQIPILEHQLDSVQYIKDSLHDEAFILHVEMGRHEITREEILTKYPKVYDEYNSYLYTQTE